MFNWFKKKPPPQPPPKYWADYLAKAPGILEDTIEAQRFVCFDTETTGLNPKQDRLLSVGAVAIQSWQMDLADSFEAYVTQSAQERGRAAIAIHGILPKDRLGNITEAEAVAAFIRYIGSAVLVGHHVDFDVAMINQHLQAHFGLQLQNRTLDTARMARRLDGKLREAAVGQPYALDRMCERFNIPTHDRHNAAGDAYITAILFLKLRHRLARRGVTSLKGLLK